MLQPMLVDKVDNLLDVNSVAEVGVHDVDQLLDCSHRDLPLRDDQVVVLRWDAESALSDELGRGAHVTRLRLEVSFGERVL